MATTKPEQSTMLALAKRSVALYAEHDRMDEAEGDESCRLKKRRSYGNRLPRSLV
jgi:hypothetical protein